MKFKIEKNPYDKRQLFPKSTIELNPNQISCFVGCNGTGKSTIIWLIQDRLRHQYKAKEIATEAFHHKLKNTDSEYCYLNFDKRSEESLDEEYFMFKAHIAYQSTGEGIIYRFGKKLALLGDFIRKPENAGKKLFIFFDDCDAGTSIDAIQDIKDVFNLITEDCAKHNITYYFIITANAFEMCRDLDCISIHNFKHMRFDNYEDFKKFVLSSRKIKDKQENEEK